MNNSIDHIRNLLSKCSNNTASEAELEELMALLDQPDEPVITHLLKQDWNNPVTVFSDGETEQLANAVIAELHSREVVPETAMKHIFHIRFRWLAAASVMLLLAAGTWFWMTKEKSPAASVTATVPDLPPGHDGAVLTLADGRQIVLDSMSNGFIANQQGVAVSLDDGRVVYEPAASNGVGVIYNTMSTPRGRQFQITLPDGTRAWLNAESSIRFPASFAATSREVSITGEVYFEVAKNTTAPFRVNIHETASIEVLGTSFNVNAYANEPGLNTTLLNGAVKIFPVNVKEGTQLKPGEQAQLLYGSGNASLKIITDADIEKVMAWKNGVFNFEGLSLQEVLRQLERWYDIKVVYNAAPGNMKYHGGMDRNVKFSDILDVFKEMGVKYEWDGKTLTIN